MIFLFVCFVLAIGILAVVRAHDRSPPRNLVTFLRRMCQESATHRENYRRLSSELADQKQGIRRASSEVLDLQNIVNGLKAQIDYAVGPCGSSPCVKGTTCRVHGESYRCECLNGYNGSACGAPHCSTALVDKSNTLPGGCQINVGACRHIKCNAAQDGCGWNTFCQPIMEEKEFNCSGTTYIENVVRECRCQPREKIVVRGRVVEQDGNDVSGIGSASMSVNDYHDEVPVDENGYFNFDIPFCPGEVVLRIWADGYLSTLKILDVPPDTLGTLDNIQVVLFELAEPVPVVVGEENILETSGAAMITILEGTTFLDNNGNEIRENVNAILNFIDPSDNDFRNSPGRFRTVDGEELVSLGVINLQFQSDVGDRLTPNGDIRISLDGLDDPEYTLWVLNSDGYWVEKISDPVVGGSQAFAGLASRKKRQTGNTYIGRFGIGDIGQWINIDKVSSASVCYIKTRIFDDLSFTSEVVDNGVDNYKPEILLKIGTGAPFQGLNLYRPPTFSPGQTCFEVRCGVTNSLGIVSVLTQETIGNGQSVLFPAVPIQLGHPQLPGSFNTELGILNYQMNTHKTEARLDFVSSPSGPLYENMTTCENSALSDNSLWFARRAPMFTDTDFGIDVCYIRFEVEASTSTNEIFDQLLAFSAWGTGPYYYTYFTAHRSEFFMMTPKFYYACLRYRCSQPSDPTTISLDHFVTNQNLTCYTSGELPAPILDAASPINGFYFGVDEIAVRGECLVETNPEKSAGSVLC